MRQGCCCSEMIQSGSDTDVLAAWAATRRLPRRRQPAERCAGPVAVRVLRSDLHRGVQGPSVIRPLAAGLRQRARGRTGPDRGPVLRHRLLPPAPLARPPQAATLMAAVADPDRAAGVQSEREVARRRFANIARQLNDRGIPCPSGADPDRNRHRSGEAWTLQTVAAILGNSRYTGRQICNRQRTEDRISGALNSTGPPIMTERSSARPAGAAVAGSRQGVPPAGNFRECSFPLGATTIAWTTARFVQVRGPNSTSATTAA
jgi:Recombinase